MIPLVVLVLASRPAPVSAGNVKAIVALRVDAPLSSYGPALDAALIPVAGRFGAGADIPRQTTILRDEYRAAAAPRLKAALGIALSAATAGPPLTPVQLEDAGLPPASARALSEAGGAAAGAAARNALFADWTTVARREVAIAPGPVAGLEFMKDDPPPFLVAAVATFLRATRGGVPVYPASWEAFASVNGGSWGVSPPPDGSRFYRFGQFEPAVKRDLNGFFPGYEQPVSHHEGLLPPPYLLGAATSLSGGFELEFARGGQSRFLQPREYVEFLARGRYPMFDEHDLRDHWPVVLRRNPAVYTDVAGTALALAEPMSARGQTALWEYMVEAVGEELDYHTTSFSGNTDLVFRAAQKAAWAMEYTLTSSNPASAYIADWAAGRGPFGAAFAETLRGIKGKP